MNNLISEGEKCSSELDSVNKRKNVSNIYVISRNSQLRSQATVSIQQQIASTRGTCKLPSIGLYLWVTALSCKHSPLATGRSLSPLHCSFCGACIDHDNKTRHVPNETNRRLHTGHGKLGLQNTLSDISMFPPLSHQ